MSRQELKDDIERKEKQLAGLHKMEAATELSLPRRSERPSVLTEKMLAYQKDELIKKDKKLISLYEQWKGLIRTSREGLKTDLSEHKLCAMADDIEKGLNDMMKVYSEIRERTMPSPDTRRKMDSCEAVTKDIMKILNERITAIDSDLRQIEKGSAFISYCHNSTPAPSTVPLLSLVSVSSLTLQASQPKGLMQLRSWL